MHLTICVGPSTFVRTITTGALDTMFQSPHPSLSPHCLSFKTVKVETVGDCYVAASGMPDPRPDHAENIAIFATRCMAEMSRVATTLEPVLGPDTADLQIRVGLHTGQVTAGVLRGLKGRFQL